MRVLRTIKEMRAPRSDRVALVPTMGAFHEGHIALMREARLICDTLVVSLFVNQTQFGKNEDFSRYPRDEERDAKMASDAGVDILFTPTAEEMYAGSTTSIVVKGVSDLWEGTHRPGHFDGVATVVCKLFNIVQPDASVFGLKDLQQCAVIRQMVVDLNLPIELRFCPTIRESDGLAMSSRNVFLTSEERSVAPSIYRELIRCAVAFANPKASFESTQETIRKSRQYLEAKGMEIDYFNLVDSKTMEAKDKPSLGDSIIAAVRIGATRLIDNVQIVA